MKFTLSIGLILLTFILSAANGNAQTEPRAQSSLQPTCVAIKPLERSTTISERNRLIKERFEQRIIPPQYSLGEQR